MIFHKKHQQELSKFSTELESHVLGSDFEAENKPTNYTSHNHLLSKEHKQDICLWNIDFMKIKKKYFRYRSQNINKIKTTYQVRFLSIIIINIVSIIEWCVSAFC